jgi:hypothetical protein
MKNEVPIRVTKIFKRNMKMVTSWNIAQRSLRNETFQKTRHTMHENLKSHLQCPLRWVTSVHTFLSRVFAILLHTKTYS